MKSIDTVAKSISLKHSLHSGRCGKQLSWRNKALHRALDHLHFVPSCMAQCQSLKNHTLSGITGVTWMRLPRTSETLDCPALHAFLPWGPSLEELWHTTAPMGRLAKVSVFRLLNSERRQWIWQKTLDGVLSAHDILRKGIFPSFVSPH